MEFARIDFHVDEDLGSWWAEIPGKLQSKAEALGGPGPLSDWLGCKERLVPPLGLGIHTRFAIPAHDDWPGEVTGSRDRNHCLTPARRKHIRTCTTPLRTWRFVWMNHQACHARPSMLPL